MIAQWARHNRLKISVFDDHHGQWWSRSGDVAVKSESVPRRTQLLFFPSLDPHMHESANIGKGDKGNAKLGLMGMGSEASSSRSVNWEEGIVDSDPSLQHVKWKDQVSYDTLRA